MAVRPIVMFPDPRLRQPAAAVTAFDAALRTLSLDLLETMRAAPRIGITAPHLGVLQRVVVIEIEMPDGARTYVNPRVVWHSAETAPHAEGSVSMPGVQDEIVRPARVRVAYQDLDGTAQEEDAADLRAVCLQHEIDQLDGIFWIDRLSALRRDRLLRRFEKLRRATRR